MPRYLWYFTLIDMPVACLFRLVKRSRRVTTCFPGVGSDEVGPDGFSFSVVVFCEQAQSSRQYAHTGGGRGRYLQELQ